MKIDRSGDEEYLVPLKTKMNWTEHLKLSNSRSTRNTTKRMISTKRLLLVSFIQMMNEVSIRSMFKRIVLLLLIGILVRLLPHAGKEAGRACIGRKKKLQSPTPSRD